MASGGAVAAPSQGGLPQEAWSALVRTTARGLTAARVRQYAGLVDRVLPVLPRPIGEKAVALVVESAGLAGLSSSSRD
jgi:hypothetical protein